MNRETPRDLARVLEHGTGSSLYRLLGRTSAETIKAATASAGWRFMRLDLGRVDNKAEFLRTAGKALDFPEWAGRNWDAFEELVNDLSWLPPAEGYLLLVERSSRLAAADPATLRMALDILRDAMGARDARPARPRVVILVRGAGELAAGLPEVEIGAAPNHKETNP